MNRQIVQVIALIFAHFISMFLLFPEKGREHIENASCSHKVTLEVVDTPEEGFCCVESTPITLTVPPDFECEPEDTFPAAHKIPDFPLIWQMPELPTGCEITALTMALQYYGYDVDKTAMAAEYLPTVYPNFSYGEGGTFYGPNMQENFVGDPFSDWGYICGVSAILTAANDYLTEQGSSHVAVDQTGASPESLYRLIAQNIPIVVWVTIEMADRYDIQGWYTESGEYMEWCTQDHGAVLIGYTEETVAIADPISGMMEYDREQFESVFESRGRQCVIIRETQEVEI